MTEVAELRLFAAGMLSAVRAALTMLGHPSPEGVTSPEQALTAVTVLGCGEDSRRVWASGRWSVAQEGGEFHIADHGVISETLAVRSFPAAVVAGQAWAMGHGIGFEEGVEAGRRMAGQEMARVLGLHEIIARNMEARVEVAAWKWRRRHARPAGAEPDTVLYSASASHPCEGRGAEPCRTGRHMGCPGDGRCHPVEADPGDIR